METRVNKKTYEKEIENVIAELGRIVRDVPSLIRMITVLIDSVDEVEKKPDLYGN